MEKDYQTGIYNAYGFVSWMISILKLIKQDLNLPRNKNMKTTTDASKGVPDNLSSLTDISMEQLQTLQKDDTTLEKIRQVMSINLDGTRQQFHEKDRLLYRQWMQPHHYSDDMEVE